MQRNEESNVKQLPIKKESSTGENSQIIISTPEMTEKQFAEWFLMEAKTNNRENHIDPSRRCVTSQYDP